MEYHGNIKIEINHVLKIDILILTLFYLAHWLIFQFSLGSNKISSLDEPILRLCIRTDDKNSTQERSQHSGSNMFELNLKELDDFIVSLEEIEKQLLGGKN